MGRLECPCFTRQAQQDFRIFLSRFGLPEKFKNSRGGRISAAAAADGRSNYNSLIIYAASQSGIWLSWSHCTSRISLFVSIYRVVGAFPFLLEKHPSLTHLSVRQLTSPTFPSFFSFPRGNFSPKLSENVSICEPPLPPPPPTSLPCPCCVVL